MRLRLALATGIACLVASIALAATAAADDTVVEVVLPDRAALDRLVATGADLDHGIAQRDGKLIAHFVGDDDEIALLRADGFQIGAEVYSDAVAGQRLAERARAIRRDLQSGADVTEAEGLKVLNARWFTTTTGTFLYVEAKSAAGESDTVTVTWDGGAMELDPFTDPLPDPDGGLVQHYLYHRGQAAITAAPAQIQVSSAATGRTVTAPVTEWLPPLKSSNGKDPYVRDFVDHYMDPTELYARIDALADEFPDIAEVVDLPYKTNGYRRPAQATFGTVSTNTGSAGNPSALSVSSIAYGSEGGNGITAELRDPGAPDAPLSVAVSGRAIVVDLATDAAGAVTSTAAQVVAAINASPGASALVLAHLPRLNAGAGVVAPAGPLTLSDNLDAPAFVSRDPFQVRALRIGKHRDGSKLGVLAYSQEHAREWQTPLVTVEAAERLLRNYATDGATRKLVDNLDIFVVPSVNPDGANFSFYDRPSQRRNMQYRCPDLRFYDQPASNAWGVDVNRNYDVGSVYDGYFGASSVFETRGCVGDTYGGLFEHSEPESSNISWLGEHFSNIRFAMNVHSSGNYFMWPPGAYKSPSRESLPRPTLGEESYFWQSADHILRRVKEQRGLSVPLSQTGPVIDVLYSAAGNSADELWYDDGIYGWDFEVGTAFQPPWPEAHEEALEFANGLIGFMEVAYDFSKDSQPPQVAAVPGQGTYAGPVGLRFETSEPATIYYTLDGSTPTRSSTIYKSSGLREGPETITLSASTTVRWFGVDAAGNASPVRSAVYTIH